eukprot:SAG31_NODE_4108_length_3576_cov_1.978142_1_plen_125_part_10
MGSGALKLYSIHDQQLLHTASRLGAMLTSDNHDADTPRGGNTDSAPAGTRQSSEARRAAFQVPRASPSKATPPPKASADSSMENTGEARNTSVKTLLQKYSLAQIEALHRLIQNSNLHEALASAI